MDMRASVVRITIFNWLVFMSCGSELTSLLPTQDQVFDAQTKPVTLSAPQRRCDVLAISECAQDSVYVNVSFPNHLGHAEQGNADAAVKSLEVFLRDPQCGLYLRSFLCLLAAPPCPRAGFEPLGPCRKVCTLARHHCMVTMKENGVTWLPDFNCNRFPETNCIGHGHPLFPHLSSDTGNSQKDQVEKTPPKLSALTKNFPKLDEANYEMHPTKPSYTNQQNPKKRHKSTSNWRKPKPAGETQNINKTGMSDLEESISTGRVPGDGQSGKLVLNAVTKRAAVKMRRYDIIELGDAKQYRGWADVQGQGAANDYCRVIGSSSKTRFLSCSLGGSTSHDHDYVSKRGFDSGHRDTWFMRDMDGDGRDDFCRCVGRGVSSHVSCMKAGEMGFYSSPLQPGSEYTFKVKKFGPCQGKRFNPLLGVKE